MAGFPTPSRKLEFYSPTLADWGWPEHALPGYIQSHVHRRALDRAGARWCCVPTFRLPTLIHTRSRQRQVAERDLPPQPALDPHPRRGAARPRDRRPGAGHDRDRLLREPGLGDRGDRARRRRLLAPPGPLAARTTGEGSAGPPRWWRIEKRGEGGVPAAAGRRRRALRRAPIPTPARIWWTDGGVHQNLTFPVHPDPVAGMHCWHQKVVVAQAAARTTATATSSSTPATLDGGLPRVARARPAPAPGPGGLRRPLWLDRPLRPAEEMFRK